MDIYVSFEKPVKVNDIEIYTREFKDVEEQELNEDSFIIRVNKIEVVMNRKNIIQIEIHK